MSKLNPAIKVIQVGVRELRDVTIYPLSFADQTTCSEIVASVIERVMVLREKVLEGGIQNNADLVKVAVDVVQENLAKVVKMVCDENPDTLLSSMTNDQVIEFATVVYEVNYAGLVKKIQALLKTTEAKSQTSIDSSLSSFEPIPNTDSKISTDDMDTKEG